jgi:5-oxoprolinase (ATP-hydrolysing)
VPIKTTKVWFSQNNTSAVELDTPVYQLEHLKRGMWISGPSIILNQTSTILIEPECKAEIDDFGNVILHVEEGSGAARQAEYNSYKNPSEVPFDPIELSIFGHRFMSIAE